MRFLYIDVDTLRPDHLGCYGYHRATSPAVDALAASGLRFENLYASDVPCLPSRTALITGRFGIRNGVVSHGGVTADPILDGPTRGFQSRTGVASWARAMRFGGMRGTTISTFAERHSAYHWCAGFSEVHNLGTMGLETADQVVAVALDWLERNGRDDSWFLHVHLWDPHTPYRAPESFGDPFASDPPPAWLTEEVRAAHWEQPGPHSARELLGFTPNGMWGSAFPRQPREASDLDQVRRMFDGYDTGVRYADEHIGRMLHALTELGVDDDTAVLVSGDHGETLGELGIYCDHHTADQHVSRVPGILRWPGVTTPGSVDTGLHYQVDLAATILELVGARVPSGWDGATFADSLRAGEPAGRDALVLSQGAWTAQRSVRWEDWLCIRTYHDGYHDLPDVLLFDLAADPNEQRDLSARHPDVVDAGFRFLEDWRDDALSRSTTAVDPLWTVLREGGPWHVRGHLVAYLERLRETGRSAQAERLAAKHAAEIELRPPASLFG